MTTDLQSLQAIRPFGGANVILADPPWAYEMYSEAGEEKSPQQHYECMSTAEIAMLPVSALANPRGCLLVMWTTGPFLASGAALFVARSWGFEPKTCGSWIKETKAAGLLDTDDAGWKAKFGTGYIFRSACEFYLVATMGSPAYHRGDEAPAVDGFPHKPRGIPNCFFEAPREHSRKPEWMRMALERRAPGPYVELFARSGRPGWRVWGKEAKKFDASNVIPFKQGAAGR